MSVTFYPNYIHSAGYDASAEPSITGNGFACSGGETSGAAYDLLDNRNTSVVTVDTDGETTNYTVDVDLSASITAANFAIVDNHNFDTSNTDFYIKYGGTTQAVASAYCGTLGEAMAAITVTANLMVNGGNGAGDGITLVNFSGTRTASGFELVSSYNDVAYTADSTLGEFAIGVKCTTTYSANARLLESYRYRGVDVAQSAGGQKYATKRYGKQRAWRLTWDLITSTDKTNLETMFDVVDGQTYPFWIDLGEAATPQLYYVRFMQDSLDFQKQTHGIWTLSIDIEEEL